MSDNNLTAQELQNILVMLQRVDLKGNEAQTYVSCENKLKQMFENARAEEANAQTED